MATPLVFDATVRNFQSDVVERSVSVPVLLDFHADWCEPCKVLAPLLEKLVTEYGGGFVLGRVDSEAEIELSQAFQVQSIPFCVLVKAGRPVDAFTGALGEEQVRQFLTRHGIAAATAADEPEEEDPDSAASRLRDARAAVGAGDLQLVRDRLADFPDDSELLQECDNLLAGLDFLEAALPQEPPAAALLASAREHCFAGHHGDALDAVLASAGLDRTYGDGLARKAMLLFQGLLGDSELVDDYRRQLATLLY